MAAGEHEFDHGLDTLLSNVRRADYQILSANGFREGKPRAKINNLASFLKQKKKVL